MHVIVEHSVGHFRPNEISSADESHAVQPLTSTNTQNPLALRRLLDFAVSSARIVIGRGIRDASAHRPWLTRAVAAWGSPFRTLG
jgi:hypothetical protein